MIIVIGFFLFLGLLGAVGFFIVKKWRELNRIHADLHQEMRILIKTSLGMGRRVSALEQRLDQLDVRQDDLRDQQSEDVAYTHAAKLVELGASVEELMQSCGLSRGEAEFLLTMQSQRK